MLLTQGGVEPVLRPSDVDEDAVIASMRGVEPVSYTHLTLPTILLV